jgi:quercetin dioxygenase-like cupin family protein
VKVQHYEQTKQQPVEMEGASGCRVRWLVDHRDGAPNFAMRHFEVEPGGHTPKHQHPYEHEVFVLEGQGEVLEGDSPHPLKPGDVVYVQPDEPHQFRNTGQGPLMILCLVPNTAAGQPEHVKPECGG